MKRLHHGHIVAMSISLLWHPLSSHADSPVHWFDLMESSCPQASSLIGAVGHVFLPLLSSYVKLNRVLL